MDGIFHGFEDEVVHHFQRRRHDALGNDGGYRVARVLDGVIDGEHGLDLFRGRNQFEDHFGGDTERPLTSHQQPREVIPGVVLGFAARPDNGPVVQDQFGPQNVIGGHSVFETVRPSGVFAEITADGGHLLACRIRGIEKAFFGEHVLEVQRDDPGLHGHGAVGQVDFQNPIHSGKVDDDSSFDRDGSPT